MADALQAIVPHNLKMISFSLQVRSSSRLRTRKYYVHEDPEVSRTVTRELPLSQPSGHTLRYAEVELVVKPQPLPVRVHFQKYVVAI